MWALFALPIVRKIAAALLVLAAIGAVLFSVYHAGEHEGARSEAGKETEAGRAQFEQISKTFEQQLAAGQQREQQMSQLAQRFADIASQASARVQNARDASATDASKVHALPDTAVKADLEAKAGGPLEDPAVLRHVDQVVTDYPHKVDEAKASSDELAAVSSRVDAIQGQLGAAQAERDAAIGAFNGLVPLYAQAYAAAVSGHRRWYCLFVCKTKNGLNLPEPASLSLPKTARTDVK